MPHARARLARARRQRTRSRKRLRANVAPTAQTVAKLRPDPVWSLLRRGTLSQEQADAAHDIRTAFEIIAAPARLRSMRTLNTADGAVYDMTRGTRGRSGGGESERVVLLQQRFNQWVAAMKQAALPVGPIIDVVVEGHACRGVDRARGRRNGWCTDLLQRGLAVYVDTRRRPRRRRAGTKKVNAGTANVISPEGQAALESAYTRTKSDPAA